MRQAQNTDTHALKQPRLSQNISPVCCILYGLSYLTCISSLKVKNERKTLIYTQLKISTYNQHFFTVFRPVLVNWPPQSLSLSHTHKHTHTRIHTHKHTHVYCNKDFAVHAFWVMRNLWWKHLFPSLKSRTLRMIMIEKRVCCRFCTDQSYSWSHVAVLIQERETGKAKCI